MNSQQIIYINNTLAYSQNKWNIISKIKLNFVRRVTKKLYESIDRHTKFTYDTAKRILQAIPYIVLCKSMWDLWWTKKHISFSMKFCFGLSFTMWNYPWDVQQARSIGTHQNQFSVWVSFSTWHFARLRIKRFAFIINMKEDDINM